MDKRGSRFQSANQSVRVCAKATSKQRLNMNSSKKLEEDKKRKKKKRKEKIANQTEKKFVADDWLNEKLVEGRDDTRQSSHFCKSTAASRRLGNIAVQ